MSENNPSAMNPNALSIGEAALLLSKAGGRRISESQLEADIESGAPTNPDGTLNLVHYAAWLVRERGARSDGD